MKVLWLCSWYPNSADPFDGDFIERHAKSLATHQKIDVIHFVQNVNLLKNEILRVEERTERNINVKIYYIPSLRVELKTLGALLFNYRYYKTLHSVLKEYIDKNGSPDIVHVHVPIKMGAGAIWLKRKFNIPFVVTEHATAYFQNSHDNYFDNGIQFKYVTKRTFSEAEAVTSVSETLMNILADLFPLKEKYIIRNSVNTALFFPLDSNNAIKKFIHVSMMVPFKNIEGILRGLANLNEYHKEWEMVFIGPASDEQRKLAESLGIDKKVVWKGAIAYEEVAKEMQNADALVHFSKYENLPCVVGEALCCGIPVISSNVGGIAEFVNESNGILVEEGNIEQLASALNAFLVHPERFNKKNISKSASEKLNYEIIGKQILNVYMAVLKQN